MGDHRIKIRMGDVEFDAEGSASDVTRQYDAFLETLRLLRGLEPAAALPNSNAAATAATAPSEPSEGKLTTEGDSESEEDEPTALSERDTLLTLLDDQVKRFKVLDRGEVAIPTLQAREVSPEDALLVLLLGYVVRKQEESLTGIWLTRSLKESGYEQVERVDELVGDPELVRTSGRYRGKRYTLTFEGAMRAYDIFEETFMEKSNAQSGEVSGGQPAPSGA